MNQVKATQASDDTVNVVEGFSARFNLLMDRAQFPAKNRLSLGARRFSVVPATFKKWCALDRIPGQHNVLVAIVDELLKDVQGHYNAKSVVAWLLAGDAVPNPFEDNGGGMEAVELYFELADLAKSKGIDFSELDREAQSLIIRRVKALISQKPSTTLEGSARLDGQTAEIALVMIDTACSLSKSRA